MSAKPYIIEEYVRWSDVDFAGIIFYGSYVRFFEIAETELFRACGLAYAQLFDRYDIFLPRKAVHSEFYFPARLDDRLRVAAYVGRVGTKSMTLNFDVLRHDAPTLRAAGWMVLVCVDRKALRPRPLPAGLVQALAPHTLTTEAARGVLGVSAPSTARASGAPAL
jgi:acyl-CoA thioester hydrolase